VKYLPHLREVASGCSPNHLSTLDSFIEIFSGPLYPLHSTPTGTRTKIRIILDPFLKTVNETTSI